MLKQMQHEAVRALLDRLARALGTDEGAQALALMQKLHRVMQPVQTQAHAGRAPARSIGVWDVKEGGALVRRADMRTEWRCWADVAELGSKRRPRVAWLGESVARAYFFDPVVTMAETLDRSLKDVGVPHDVIDLARIDLKGAGMRELLAHVELVHPDVVVMFAGNNWHDITLEPGQLERLLACAAAGEFPGGTKAAYEAFVRADVQRTMRALKDAAVRAGARPIVVIPEFNLAEWNPEPGVGVVTLPGEQHCAWVALAREAERAAASGVHDRALELASRMREIDQGCSAQSEFLRARCLVALHREAEAREAFRAARDAPIGTFTPHSPRSSSAVQDTMRTACTELGIEFVDLPRSWSNGSLAALGAYFLDYCHLSELGIRDVVQQVTGQIAGKVAPVEAFSAPVVGTAHLLAAVHNAHYGQAPSVVERRCRDAATSCAEVRHLLADFLDFHPRAEPAWLSRSFARAAASKQLLRYLHDERAGMKLSDGRLWDACAVALDKDTAVWHPAEIGHLEPRSELDLLQPRRSARTFREASGFSLGRPASYKQYHVPQSEFDLVLRDDESVDWSLEIVARAPGAGGAAAASLQISINRAALATLALTANWIRSRVRVPGERLRAGSNLIRFEWPVATAPSEQTYRRGLIALELGRTPSVLPVFGELQSVRLLRPMAASSEGTSGACAERV